MERFVAEVQEGLLPHLDLASENPYDPVVVRSLPKPWKLLGTGNYAAVFIHPMRPQWAVKVYAPGRPGLEAEVAVYRKLGSHPAYSELLYADERFLVLRRLTGVTLYECLRRGIRIPEQAIRDIDEALDYARRVGLHPHDVHGKNVMLQDGRGVVVDVSDFGEPEEDTKWTDLKRAYYRFYLPYWSKLALPVPGVVLNLLRKSYRFYRKHFASSD